MITINGSHGEGGGQILRSSLALSLITGKPFCIEGIRGKRKKPGLLRQHLTAVNAAVEIGKAKVTGNAIGSSTLEFTPGGIFSGKYHFAVGTAGSATLVLQTILPALLTAAGESELIMEGGTHNPWAPPFDFLARVFLPIINNMGPTVSATLLKYGFYPAGGGKFSVTIIPSPKLQPIDLLERGEVESYKAEAIVSKIPVSIGDRELRVVADKLPVGDRSLVAREVSSPGPGNILQIEVASANVTELFIGFGEKGVKAERVASSTVRLAREYIAANVPVGRYLADQLLLPLAIAGGGSFRTLSPSNHTLTNIEVLKHFLDVEVTVSELEKNMYEISIRS